MPIKRPQLVSGEIYHIVVRGVEGRSIFQEISDYYRAIHDLFEFNDEAPAAWQHRSFYNLYEDGPRSIGNRVGDRGWKKKPRKLLVKILAFCLMPNHIHLLLHQREDQGITRFMRKLGTGYALYFNKKYQRQGYLFQGRFRAILIKTNEQLEHVFVYIHTNPASLVDAGWKEGKVKDPAKVINTIENYRWSSYMDYLGKENFPSVTQRDFFNKIMPRVEWQKFVNDWVRYKSIKEFADIILE
ncbi:MAG: transposase [Candidatus Portnoybacteria bacterium]|nr:transposase [Candidatus Portnoybacteria bacterium]